MTEHQQADQYRLPPNTWPHIRIIVLSGLPGVGKTLVAAKLTDMRGGIHVNADTVRQTLTKHLGFSPEDRIAQGTAMGQIAKIIADSGHLAIVDFVAPTWPARFAFAEALGVHRYNARWFELMKHRHVSRFEDTGKLYSRMIEATDEQKKQLGIHTLKEIDMDSSVLPIVQISRALKD